MKKNLILLCAFACSVFIMSCQKEIDGTLPVPIVDTTGLPIDDTTGTSTGDTTGNAVSVIAGNWKFISLEVTTSAANELSLGTDVIRTVTNSHYTTENNAGTITIDSVNLIANNLSYSVNSVAKSSIYTNGVLTDSLEIPLVSSQPPYSVTSAYTRSGTDSLYFPGGSLFTGGYAGVTSPGSVRVRVVQDKLYFYQAATQTTTTTDQGQNIIITITASIIATFQRI